MFSWLAPRQARGCPSGEAPLLRRPAGRPFRRATSDKPARCRQRRRRCSDETPSGQAPRHRPRDSHQAKAQAPGCRQPSAKAHARGGVLRPSAKTRVLGMRTGQPPERRPRVAAGGRRCRSPRGGPLRPGANGRAAPVPHASTRTGATLGHRNCSGDAQGRQRGCCQSGAAADRVAPRKRTEETISTTVADRIGRPPRRHAGTAKARDARSRAAFTGAGRRLIWQRSRGASRPAGDGSRPRCALLRGPTRRSRGPLPRLRRPPPGWD